MVRHYTSDAVLVNAYEKDDQPDFQSALMRGLGKEGLKVIPVPYYPYSNPTADSAVGVYLNFLHLQHIIWLPIFGTAQDELAYRVFDELFPANVIVPVQSTEIARHGGVLNCITWNIKLSDVSGKHVRLFSDYEFS
jgi:agmatine deiminase